MTDEENKRKKASEPPLPAFDPYAKVMESIEKQNETINQLAKAVLALNDKIEAQKASGGGGTNEVLSILREFAGEGKGSSSNMDSFVRQAEGMARAGAAIDSFRNPYRISPAEAMLMRAGLDRLRHPLPRYMSREELRRYEKILGVEGALEGFEEGGGEGGGHGAPE